MKRREYRQKEQINWGSQEQRYRHRTERQKNHTGTQTMT
jgi:hypothetical protein